MGSTWVILYGQWKYAYHCAVRGCNSSVPMGGSGCRWLTLRNILSQMWRTVATTAFGNATIARTVNVSMVGRCQRKADNYRGEYS